MLRDGHPVGVITVGREAARPFPSEQIELLKTFADQAVIAIENVRLFTELQEKNRALTAAHAQVTEALEQQTATAEILHVISRSQTDVQPVFDTIVKSAVRLCDGLFSALFRFDGELIHHAAQHNYTPAALEELHRVFPARPTRALCTGRAILERAVVHIPDVEVDPEHQHQALRRAIGWRSGLFVPMLREGAPIGVIEVARSEAGPFSEEQIALLKTFADQAVIAVENVRLFTELEARNHDLTEALDKQTATSEILRVISGSQTDVQPVFDTIIQSAVRLLGGFSGVITQIVDDQLHLAALTSTNPSGDAAQKALWPKSLKQDGSLHGHVIRALAPQATTDVESDRSVPPIEVTVARERGYRSMVAVPLLRDGRAVGSMAVTRRAPGPFADGQVALLQTFADQAVIAIENVRLFKELDARTRDLSRSVAELRALSEVGQAISSTLDLQAVLSTIVARATELSGTDAGVVYEYDEQREVFLPRATEHLEAEVVEAMLATPVRKGEGATGRLAEVHEPIQLADILEAPAESRVRSVLVRAGYRALLAVPLVREDRLIGGLTVIRKATGAFAPEVIELLRTFATQSALAIQNARLFLEIADKSQQLEAASRHKSEFLANMSHELRTPLNAIIGFSEVLMQRMFGELNTKQEEYLKDIYESGRHLLSLINDILDLSKIEAGRMELELTAFDLPTAIDSALTLVRERASRRGIVLEKTLDERVGPIRADERKVRQVVLNLLSNAIKFTPEGGRIEVRAVPVDSSVEVSVADTGVGIAPEDQEAVFEEFRQVGSSAAKQEGTGLGLALCRKFVELHDGTIWVTSAVGAGSTFTFRLPVRP
jgi:signal transduction histidine kinase